MMQSCRQEGIKGISLTEGVHNSSTGFSGSRAVTSVSFRATHLNFNAGTLAHSPARMTLTC